MGGTIGRVRQEARAKQLDYKELKTSSSCVEYTQFSTKRITVWALKFAKPWPSKSTQALTSFW